MVEQQTQNNTFVLPIVLGWPNPEGGEPSSFLMLASLNDFPMERMVKIGIFIEYIDFCLSLTLRFVFLFTFPDLVGYSVPSTVQSGEEVCCGLETKLSLSVQFYINRMLIYRKINGNKQVKQTIIALVKLSPCTEISQRWKMWKANTVCIITNKYTQ